MAPLQVLVSGAGGFIGRAASRELVLRGHRVIRGVRSADAVPGSVVVGDVGPDTDWTTALQGCDTVLHLAGRAHRRGDTDADALALFRSVNVSGSVRLMQQAEQVGVRRFVFVSSIGVNGNRSKQPFTESDPVQPVEPYAVSKLEAEQQLTALAEQSGMELVIVRPPLVYGPGAPGNFGRLARLTHRPLPLPFGAIDNRRSMVGLENLVDFLILCLHHAGAANRTFLIADGEDVSTADLIRMMRRSIGRNPGMFAVPLAWCDRLAGFAGMAALWERLSCDLQIDASRARALTGWSPVRSLEQGIRSSMGAGATR